jgi:hypothetical protein
MSGAVHPDRSSIAGMDTVPIKRGPPTEGMFHVGDPYEWQCGEARYNGVICDIAPLPENQFELSIGLSDEEYARYRANS